MPSKLLPFLLASLASTAVFSGSIDIPNTFTAGEKAVAEEVNQNFTVVKTGINDNDSRISTLETSDSSDKDTDASNELQNLQSVLAKGNSANDTTISNLAEPVLDNDAATKAYVDALLARIDTLEAASPFETVIKAEGRDFFVLKGGTYSGADAQTACERNGMDLAKVSTEAQNLAIASYWGRDKPNSLIWIGVNDLDNEGTLVHRDGEAVDDSWVSWYLVDSTHPNKDAHDCVSMAGTYTFRDQGQGPAGMWGWENCIHSRYAVCSR